MCISRNQRNLRFPTLDLGDHRIFGANGNGSIAAAAISALSQKEEKTGSLLPVNANYDERCTPKDRNLPVVNLNKTRHTKKVTFDNIVTLRRTISRQDMTPQEHSATWYSTDEYTIIRHSCIKQISKLERGEKLKDKKYCTLGLEGHTESGKREKHYDRFLAIDTVLEIQDRDQHHLLPEVKAEQIALAYRKASANAVSRAALAAITANKSSTKTHVLVPPTCSTSSTTIRILVDPHDDRTARSTSPGKGADTYSTPCASPRSSTQNKKVNCIAMAA